jgi:hypothetical protein
MRSVRFHIRVTTNLLVLFCATAIGVSAQPLEETLIFNFAGLASRSGDGPFSNLVFDPQGNLYGTTYRGGTGNCIDHNKNIVWMRNCVRVDAGKRSVDGHQAI